MFSYIRMMVVVLFALTLFAGCVGVHNSEKPITDRNADRVECEEKVRAMNAGASTPTRPQDEIRMVNECMRKKGWK